MYYSFKVKYFDEDYDEYIDSGLVSACDYNKATNLILEDYGENNIISIFIEILEEDSSTLDLEEIENLVKRLNKDIVI